jgi:hypothetical protein
MLLLSGALFVLTHPSVGQRVKPNQKLPSAEKIVERYLKAIGGKKKAVAIRDVVLEWTIELQGRSVGRARHYLMPPACARSEMRFENGQIITAANSSSTWSSGLDGNIQTLTGTEAATTKLQALLDAGHLVNFKKVNVAARTVSVEDSDPEPSYVVAFSTRTGGKLLYHFARTSGLITKITDEARNITTIFSEYRAENGLVLPHKTTIDLQGTGRLNLVLQKAQYNVGFSASIFDPPAAAEVLDVSVLLREVEQNQDELEKRFTEYSFVQRETDREVTSKGEVKKESSKTFEVFPLPNREPVLKLIEENGVALSLERAAKEEKRVNEEFKKAERDRDGDEDREQKRRAERERRRAAGKDDEDIEISQFLKMCEFVSPRRERFRERDAVVFDFRPRPGFRPRNREEDLISKLVGVIWIDPVDRQVIRLEARLAQAFKMAGGLLFSLRPGATVVMEQIRMQEGLWLPRFAQINLSMKVLLFGGGDVNKIIEWSDYKHFSGDVSDYKIDAPKSSEERKPEPFE